MNKAELIEKVAQDTECTKAQAERLLDATLDIIRKTVKKGDDFEIIKLNPCVEDQDVYHA